MDEIDNRGGRLPSANISVPSSLTHRAGLGA